MWIFQASGLPSPPPGDLPNSGIKPRSPVLQADSLPSEPPGKPKNTRVGSLSLLQGIFLTQKSNWGLLHCRWILYQLSYQRSPVFKKQTYRIRKKESWWFVTIAKAAHLMDYTDVLHRGGRFIGQMGGIQKCVLTTDNLSSSPVSGGPLPFP